MSAAPWPLIDDIKLGLKMSLTDTSLDGEVAALMAAAESFIQYFTNETVASSPYVDIDRTLDDMPTATFAPPTTLILTHMPVDLATAITVTQYDGTVLDTIAANTASVPAYSTTKLFYVDPIKGLLYAVSPGNVTFGQGPYTITYNAGLSCHPQWATRHRAIAGRVVRDFVAWFSEQPNPGVKVESAGAGVSASWSEECIPPRLLRLVRMLPNAGMTGLGMGT